MKKRISLFALLVVVLVLIGPSASAQVRTVRTITVTNCLNGAELIPNVAVTASGERTEVTSFTGEARINVARDTPVTFEAPGFETYYTIAGDDTRFCLLVDQDDSYILRVFHRNFPTEQVLLLGTPGKGPAKEVFVLVDDEYKVTNPDGTRSPHPNVAKGFQLLTNATAGLQKFAVVNQVPVGVVDPVVVSVKTNSYRDVAMGVYHHFYGSDGYSVTGCEIFIRDPEFISDPQAPALLGHEGGHCFGMDHGGTGLMAVDEKGRIITDDFSNEDVIAMRSALIRGQGHKFLDRDKRLPF